MAKRHYYSIKARRHERAAAKARSHADKEGHKEVARGYHKLARGSHKSAVFHFRKGKRVKSRRRGKRGRFI